MLYAASRTARARQPSEYHKVRVKADALRAAKFDDRDMFLNPRAASRCQTNRHVPTLDDKGEARRRGAYVGNEAHDGEVGRMR